MRRPPNPERSVPTALAERLDDGRPLPEAPAERSRTLLQSGVAALEEALRSPPSARGTGYRLLDADALLTEACEWTALAPDPGALLAEAVCRIADGHPDDSGR